MNNFGFLNSAIGSKEALESGNEPVRVGFNFSQLDLDSADENIMSAQS